MALWRDPLQELVEELERAVAPASGPGDSDGPPPFEDVQLAVQATLLGHGDARARAEQDSRLQAVWAYYAKLARGAGMRR